MRTAVVYPMILGFALSSTAQFYPAASACWFGVGYDGGPPGSDLDYWMETSPDTAINGVVYQKVRERIDQDYTRTYYVRSDASGKGYAYVPELGAEHLTGDVTAQVGDTVHDVLLKNTIMSGVGYEIGDILVDSVVTLTNAGVTVTRHYLNHQTSLGLYTSFWQRGMGVCSGPILEGSGSFHYCSVADTVMFDLSNSNGLPGPIGVPVCPLVVSGVGNIEPLGFHDLQALTNPYSGLFVFSDGLKHSYTVITPHGSAILEGNSSVIDLAGQPTGIYTAVVGTPQGRRVLRLVVLR